MSVGTCSRIWEWKSAIVHWLFVFYSSHQDELWMMLGNITHRRKLINAWYVAATDRTSVRTLSLVNTANIFLVSCPLNCFWLLLHCCMWGCRMGRVTPLTLHGKAALCVFGFCHSSHRFIFVHLPVMFLNIFESIWLFFHTMHHGQRP